MNALIISCQLVRSREESVDELFMLFKVTVFFRFSLLDARFMTTLDESDENSIRLRVPKSFVLSVVKTTLSQNIFAFVVP